MNQLEGTMVVRELREGPLDTIFVVLRAQDANLTPIRMVEIQMAAADAPALGSVHAAMVNPAA